jgi:hypothetical protein
MPDYILSEGLSDLAEMKFSRKMKNKEVINLVINSFKGDKNAFEDLLFISKYLSGILRAAAKPDNPPNAVLYKEIITGIEKVKGILKLFLTEKYNEIGEIYFRQDNENLASLTTLLSDLELLKFYINDLKREG